MTSIPYKLPTIVRGKKYWHVAYFFEVPNAPGKFKKFQVKDGINYTKDLDQREIEIRQLRDDVELALKNGFNPFLPQITVDRQLKRVEEEIADEKSKSKTQLWSIKKGEEEFTKYGVKKNLSAETMRKYKSYFSVFNQWIDKNDLKDISLSKLSEDHITDFLDQSFEDYSWSPRTYNNYLNFLSTFFTRVLSLEKRKNKEVEYSIDFDFLELKNSRAEKNKYYTESVANLIKKEIDKDIELNRYVRWIFYSCMRPNEIRHLKIERIDFNARQIKIDGKTGFRFVPICDELLLLMKEMELEESKIDNFVFGKGGKPSPEMVHSDYFRDRYRPIKIKHNLDMNYTLYSWKHTRVVSLIAAGFDDNQVMTLTGHRDRAGFEAYKRELVIDNTIMKGKTITF
ncbi:tyrosine-type recombinase/integrase [Sphingobacterium multivorum]|uniref:tyrosine-type recombinase/integrase n=1 Tax=Sphingobacterium multivorum TaxID=28454 RepID=UPI0028AF851D|nr:tyrosine-type recombinase/integrase [Sphingobacterium multivorum]